MKKLILFILIFVFITSSAAAEYKISKEDNAAIKFNAYGNSFGIPQLDSEKIIRSGNIVIFPMDGYDVMFLFDANEKIESAGVRMKSETAAGDFLLSCMTLVSMLGEFDYTSYGMILFQYSQIKSGKEESIPYAIAGDEFIIQSGPDGFVCLFAYANVKNE